MVEDPAHEMKGVTVDLLSAIDLGPEVEGMAGLQLRMRMVTIEPGGVFGPLHDHKGRPGMVYVLQGTITDHQVIQKQLEVRFTDQTFRLGGHGIGAGAHQVHHLSVREPMP